RQTGDAPSNKNVWQLLRWTFIVATSTPPEAAPILGFWSLRCANTKIYPQIIYKRLWVSCGRFRWRRLRTESACNSAFTAPILLGQAINSLSRKSVSVR
ncbi:MAG TPA: hypothetical protein VJM48_07035, partial [Methylibium sp.]|nr:hypothetical protein [Methylibium sp.]